MWACGPGAWIRGLWATRCCIRGLGLWIVQVYAVGVDMMCWCGSRAVTRTDLEPEGKRFPTWRARDQVGYKDGG